MLAAAALLCVLADPRITESSGLAAARPGTLLTHDDSGGEPAVFAVATRTCRVRATYRLAGARNQDWEDMAVARGRLYLADIGDNAADRPDVSVYTAPALRPPYRTGTLPATRYTFSYPDGPHDAETLLVDPRSGRVYLATKSLLGGAVYAAPWPLRSGRLRRVADLGLVLATGGGWSPDGSQLVVRTYTDAYRWTWRGSMAATLAAAPRRVPLPEQRQGESVAFSADGRRLLATSEGADQPVYAVPVPVPAPPPPRLSPFRPLPPL